MACCVSSLEGRGRVAIVGITAGAPEANAFDWDPEPNDDGRAYGHAFKR